MLKKDFTDGEDLAVEQATLRKQSCTSYSTCLHIKPNFQAKVKHFIFQRENRLLKFLK